MLNLSARQVVVLRALLGFARERGYMPSIRELARELGIAYATVRQHLDALKARGWLASDGTPHGLTFARGRERALRELETAGRPASASEDAGVRVPIVGTIAAGQPIEAIEEIRGEVVVPPTMAGPGAYALRVRGDSMVEDHILDGDVVVVVPRSRVADGEVAVALLDDGTATLKRVYAEGRAGSGRVRLQPANSSMKPIYARNVRIQGRISGLIRAVR